LRGGGARLTARGPQDGGARIKELKRRWPRVFIYVEKDNTLTVRGSVQEEVDACFLLALFFKVASRPPCVAFAARLVPCGVSPGCDGGRGGCKALVVYASGMSPQ